MAKITKATFKSFLRKNEGKLHIRLHSYFDGMTDGTEFVNEPKFVPVEPAQYPCENNFGISGVWLVHSSGNSFEAYEKNGFRGIEVYNCCRSFTIAVPIA